MNERQPVVLVTGASGFVGRHLVPALAHAGWSVRRAVRSPEGADDEVVIKSIGPETDWQAALEGVDAVIHLAARDSDHVRDFVMEHLSAHPAVSSTRTSIVFHHYQNPVRPL